MYFHSSMSFSLQFFQKIFNIPVKNLHNQKNTQKLSITFKKLLLLVRIMYDLETDRLIARIKEKGHKTILIQLADGIKPRAAEVVDKIRKETDAECLIWLGSCFGACDVPFGLNQLGVDFVVQWGHNFFRKRQEGW